MVGGTYVMVPLFQRASTQSDWGGRCPTEGLDLRLREGNFMCRDDHSRLRHCMGGTLNSESKRGYATTDERKPTYQILQTGQQGT
jgi:hypothetical protein